MKSAVIPIIPLAILLGILIPLGAVAMAVEEDALSVQVRAVAKTLRCAVCQSESIDESNAKLARQMREVIRDRLQQGETPDEIRAYFVSRYGDYILLKPRKTGWNWTLWLGPFVMLAVGAVLLTLRLRRWSRPISPDPEETPSPALDEARRQRIERERQSGGF